MKYSDADYSGGLIGYLFNRATFKMFAMGMRNYICIIMLLPLISCSTQGQSHKEGQFTVSYQLQNSVTGEKGFQIVSNFWYRDSLSVQEVRLFMMNTIHEKTTYSYRLMYYLFVDMRKGLVYKYPSFSDTAKIMDIYSALDTARRDRDNLARYYHLEVLPHLSVESKGIDTVVNGISYQRDIIWKQDHQLVYKEINLHRCDWKSSIFTLDYYGLPDDDCPVTTNIIYGTKGTYPYFTNELNYVSDTLTPEQRKVFDAWERNADCNATVPKLPYISPFPKPVRKVVRIKN